MNYKKRLSFAFIKLREPLFGFIAGGLLTAGLLLYKLGSLVPGLSASEVSIKIQSSTVGNIISSPVYLPYKSIQWLILYINNYSIATTRLVSVLYASIFIGLMFYILFKWYTARIAFIGTLLFATSAWFLHFARSANPSILYLSTLGLVAYGTWIKYTNRHEWAVIIGILLSAYLVYIPGMVWFVVLGLLWQRKSVAQLLKNASNISYLASFLFLGLILPLAWGVFHKPLLLQDVFGVPASIPELRTIVSNLVSIPKQLFLIGPSSPETWLDNLPILNVFLIAMLLMGSYAFFLRSRLDRAKMILGGLLVSIILIAFNGPIMLMLLMPFVFLLITGGIALMLQRWFTVFPKNPLARIIGIILICLALMVSVSYELKHYFIAWPNSPTTKSTFTKRL